MRHSTYAEPRQAGGRPAEHKHQAGQAGKAGRRPGTQQARQASTGKQELRPRGLCTRAFSHTRAGPFFPSPLISPPLAHCTQARHAGGKRAKQPGKARPASRHHGGQAEGRQGAAGAVAPGICVLSDLMGALHAAAAGTGPPPRRGGQQKILYRRLNGRAASASAIDDATGRKNGSSPLRRY